MSSQRIQFRHLVASLIATASLTPAISSAADLAKKILSDAQQFGEDKPAALQPIFNALYVEGEHNAVLNLDYLGLASLELGNYTIAERAFDAAIERIETIYADNPSAQKAKSVFAAEKVKDFKGEPYERAMTYYYRGVLYLRVGDYQNARASFLSAERQTTLSENESYDSSFGLMDYLAAWASFCDGDAARAQELQERASKVQPVIFTSLSPTATYVNLIDLGTGPVKSGVGQYKEKLTFRPSAPTPAAPTVTSSGAGLNAAVLAGDLNYQATTRGGRPVDTILNGKAQWKSGTDVASTALTAVGYTATLEGVASGNQGLQNAGTIGMAVGLLGGLFAHAMTPEADTRAWSTLPGGIAVAAGDLGVDGVPTASFTDGSGSSGSSMLNAHAGKCAVSWGRTDSSLATIATHLQKPVLAEHAREARNAQFREFLTRTFAVQATPTVSN
ncbi:MAG: hypothetical protein ACJ8R9_24420 [Steroidobacteraceae bacterium]